MKRQIIFRGKRLDNSGWLYGYLREIYGEDERIFVIAPAKRFEACGYTDMDEDYVDSDTIGQFTGLHDKNGKEIYEGDILMCIGQREDNMGQKYYRKVLFNNGSFGMEIPEYNCTSSLCNHVVNGKLDWEVIGNIYDNPELLNN